MSLSFYYWPTMLPHRESVTIKATVDRTKILIGEPILLTIEADIPEKRYPLLADRQPSLILNSWKTRIDTINTKTVRLSKDDIRSPVLIQDIGSFHLLS